MEWVNEFHKQNTPEERSLDSSQKLKQHPDRVPVIIDRASPSAPKVDRHKFLCPKNTTMAQFSFVVRKRMELAPEQAVSSLRKRFRSSDHFASNEEVYDSHAAEDGCLHVTYSLENTFG